MFRLIKHWKNHRIKSNFVYENLGNFLSFVTSHHVLPGWSKHLAKNEISRDPCNTKIDREPGKRAQSKYHAKKAHNEAEIFGKCNFIPSKQWHDMISVSVLYGHASSKEILLTFSHRNWPTPKSFTWLTSIQKWHTPGSQMWLTKPCLWRTPGSKFGLQWPAFDSPMSGGKGVGHTIDKCIRNHT